MFDGNIIEDYVNKREGEDVLAACRAAVKQCFDNYGGTGYENFYYPYSGLFKSGKAPDWFALYDTDGKTLKSPCAQQVAEISSCKDIIEQAFGGLDVVKAQKCIKTEGTNKVKSVDFYKYNTYPEGLSCESEEREYYGISGVKDNYHVLFHRNLRPVGVATEIYNQIIDTLSTQCANVQGRFIQVQFLQDGVYNEENYCQWHEYSSTNDPYAGVHEGYGIYSKENMCPRDYTLSVDTQSWGSCSCWGNGGRRSKNGRAATCAPVFPIDADSFADRISGAFLCDKGMALKSGIQDNPNHWCTQNNFDNENRVCPFKSKLDNEQKSCTSDGVDILTYYPSLIPEGM